MISITMLILLTINNNYLQLFLISIKSGVRATDVKLSSKFIRITEYVYTNNSLLAHQRFVQN